LKDAQFDLERFKEFSNSTMIIEEIKACKNILKFIGTSTGLTVEKFWEHYDSLSI